jgi:glycosyl transferase, family 25
MGRLNRHKISIPTYVINLDRAVDRLSHMEATLSDLSMSFERIPAIDGKSVHFTSADFAERTYTLLHGRRRNPAEIGCYLSHIECARRLLASSAEHALVLEDDVSLPEDIHDLVHTAIAAGSDWDILRLSSVNDGAKYPFRELTAKRSLAIALTREKGSGAYIINRSAAKWFVTRLLPMRLPFDLAFDLEHFACLKAAFVRPVPVSQDIGLISQIQGHRRAFHLSRWCYVVVQPYRAWLETTRLLFRLGRLLFLLARSVADRDTNALSRGQPADDLYLADMALPPRGAATERTLKDGRAR